MMHVCVMTVGDVTIKYNCFHQIRDDFLGRAYLHFHLDDPSSFYYYQKV